MLSVGGSIGTGLLLGSAAIHIAGPAVVLSFLLGGAIIWTVAMAMGELASAQPRRRLLRHHADLYLNRWAGFVSRYGYWYAMVVAIGAEFIASATYARHWFPQVPAALCATWPAIQLRRGSAIGLGCGGRPEQHRGRREAGATRGKSVTDLLGGVYQG
jgi:L-asparagine transporter-like permease